MLVLRFTALNLAGYYEALHMVEQLQTIKQLSWSRKRFSWRRNPGRDWLVIKERDILLELMSISKSKEWAEWTELLKDSRQEVTAFDDLLTTLQRVHPHATPILKEVGSMLLSTEQVPVTLANYRDLLKSTDLEYVIREQSEFGRAIGMPVYVEANDTYLGILQYAATNYLSLLSLVEGEV
ncbi:MAG: hypothetical protein H8E47_13830 [Anaerolineales bacterium]|nr:hypothetical protein [Anaerolineales bacterium]